MGYKKLTAQQLLIRFLLGLVLIIMVWSTISSSGENKRLKTAIKENLIEIDRLESEKISIFESIKEDSLAIIAKDAIILSLSQTEDSLNNTLNNFRNEKLKIKNSYLSNDVAKRVDVFSELASESDSIR